MRRGGCGDAMPDAAPEPSDLIDTEAPTSGGEKVDTVAYARASERGPKEPDLAHPGAGETLDVEAPVSGSGGVRADPRQHSRHARAGVCSSGQRSPVAWACSAGASRSTMSAAL